MTFTEFEEMAKEKILDYLPGDYSTAEIEQREVRKINQSYPAFIVRKEGNNVAASLNLAEFFEMTENGASLDKVFGEMARIIQQGPRELNGLDLMDYETAKESLFIRVCDLKTNRELLKNIPHTEVKSLAVTYHMLAAIEDQSLGSIMITNEIMDKWGVSKEQLHTDAVHNSQIIMPVSIEPLENMLMSMVVEEKGVNDRDIFKQLNEIDFKQSSMLVLTNRQRVNGAAVMFYPDVLQTIGVHANSNFYILPSSTHEVLLVKDDVGMKSHELERMVKEVNSSAVMAKDRLSDNVFHYDRNARLFEKAVDYEARMAEKEESASRKQHEKAWKR